MGTWDIGPFDNDVAADWCNDLDDAASQQREPMIRAVLMAVLDQEGYLDGDLAAEAIAAAAVLASQRPEGAPITWPYGPDFLREGGTLQLSADLDSLAVRTLDRIVGEESEWRELWEDVDRFDDARALLATMRGVLAA